MDESTKVNARKIKADIQDLKDKKGSLIRSLQNDVDATDAKIAQIYSRIGEKAYALHLEGADTMVDLAGEFANIQQHKADQEAKRKKMAEIASRYDEEITLLEKLVPEGEAADAHCDRCGQAYTPGEDLFCSNCGTRL